MFRYIPLLPLPAGRSVVLHGAQLLSGGHLRHVLHDPIGRHQRLLRSDWPARQ